MRDRVTADIASARASGLVGASTQRQIWRSISAIELPTGLRRAVTPVLLVALWQLVSEKYTEKEESVGACNLQYCSWS